jgi:diguanylate cyclase
VINNPLSSQSPTQADDPEQAAEYLRLAIAFLGQHGMAPNPVNFSLGYDYIVGHNPGLREALDQELASGPLTADAARRLYQRYIWDDDKRRLEEMRTELRTLLMETLGGVSQARLHAEQSAGSLTEKSKRLEQNPSLNEMREILGEVVGETRAIAHNSQLLKNMLDETRRDVDALRVELERARQQVTTDALTGLANRRGFEAALHEACDQATKNLGELTLILLDIDHFKNVNDTYGHLVGDKVIRNVGTLLSENIKGKDTVARLGGEEFAVLLPDTTLTNAARVAEALRAAIERSRLRRSDTGEAVGLVTVSMGVTVFHPNDSYEDFFGRADQALYTAKREGRNRVSILDVRQVTV